MSHFEPAADLDLRVAESILAPRIESLAARVEDEAKRGAPDAKTWITARDERVRPSHVYADGQQVPDNLRYKLPKTQPDLHRSRSEVAHERVRGPNGEFISTGGGDPGLGAGFDLARAPRDPDLPVGNRINCRCESVPIPRAVARDIHREPTRVEGTTVRSTIVCTYPRAAEAEYGTDKDTGAHFMSGALRKVADESK